MKSQFHDVVSSSSRESNCRNKLLPSRRTRLGKGLAAGFPQLTARAAWTPLEPPPHPRHLGKVSSTCKKLHWA